MQTTDKAIQRIIEIEEEAGANSTIHNLHPLTKLLLTAAFLGFLVSYQKYNLTGLLLMGIYPLVMFTLSGVGFTACLKRIWPVIPLFGLFGFFNIFTDRQVAITIGGIGVTYGIISAFVLLLKGVLALVSGYLLIATTGIENICYGLSKIGLPTILVTQILLTYRYLTLLIQQAGEVFTAYQLRAPGQKGIRLTVWGSLIGQILLRTIDRGECLYESMILRGYDGTFYLRKNKKTVKKGIPFLAGWILFFIITRYYNLPYMIGNIVINFTR